MLNLAKGDNIGSKHSQDRTTDIVRTLGFQIFAALDIRLRPLMRGI